MTRPLPIGVAGVGLSFIGGVKPILGQAASTFRFAGPNGDGIVY